MHFLFKRIPIVDISFMLIVLYLFSRELFGKDDKLDEFRRVGGNNRRIFLILGILLVLGGLIMTVIDLLKGP